MSEVCERLESQDRGLLELREELGSLAAELASLRSPPPLPPMRDPEGSYHDFDDDVKEFRRALKRHDSVRARQIAKEAVRSAEQENKAAHWDKLVQTGWKVLVGVAVGVLVTIILIRLGVHP